MLLVTGVVVSALVPNVKPEEVVPLEPNVKPELLESVEGVAPNLKPEDVIDPTSFNFEAVPSLFWLGFAPGFGSLQQAQASLSASFGTIQTLNRRSNLENEINVLTD